MSIGNLSLTTSLKPDISKLKESGSVRKENTRRRIYKNFCKLEFAEVMWEPHKFNLITNWVFVIQK